MREARVKDIYDWLDSIAPFESAENFDNVGLLVGSMETRVRGILLALDVTGNVISEAVERGAQLIVTHHPLMFHPTQRIMPDVYEGAMLAGLLRHGIALIAAHTNMDKTPYSGSARLSEMLQIGTVSQGSDYLFMIHLAQPQSAGALEAHLENKLGRKIIRFGEAETTVCQLAVAGGAYDDGFALAQSLGAQALLTGEVRHHNAIAAVHSGMVLFEGGHYATEAPMLPPLCDGLQKALDSLEYHVQVFCSHAPVY